MAEPGSGCGIIIIAGKNMMANALIWVLIFFKLTFGVLKKFARTRAVANFANSDGCSEKDPIPYHDVAPATFLPKIKSPIRLTIDIM